MLNLIDVWVSFSECQPPPEATQPLGFAKEVDRNLLNILTGP